MRRILAPAGYGATHPDAENNDPQGRELNRRVDVKLVVNKGINGRVVDLPDTAYMTLCQDALRWVPYNPHATHLALF